MKPLDERGLSQSVQYVVIFPVLMLVTLGIIQAGISVHSHHVAIRAASAGADAAHGSYGSAADAQRVARYLAEAGGLADVGVTVTRRSGEVLVTVTGRAPLIFDIAAGRVKETARAPVERVTPP